MSCLDNTDILRIVGGNSFQIAITVKARRVADGSEIEDFDLSASSPVLNLIHAGEKTRKYFVIQGNQAIISFDGSEGLGYYGIEMSGSYNSEAWRFCIEKVLQLVDTNAKANIPEWSFLVDDTYFIEGTISIYGGGGGGDTVQADWTETNPTSAAFILHKPDLSVYATKAEVASGLAGKQDTIEDLSAIREGAAAGATAYQKPASGIPESDMSEGVQSALDKADSAYQKPSSGIPATDMSESVQASLDKANSAVQTETDPVFSGSPAAEITQADINNWNAKQSAIADLADIREGAAAGATAVQPDEMAQAIDGVDGDIDAINAKIPTAASNLNQLADKAYVNSSIATNSATYRGSFNLITDLGMNVDATHAQIAGALATAIATADNNDYAFVQIPDSASTPTVIAKIERYKHNGSGWVYEYDLNNSGFTAAQWAAINSGITSGLVGKLADLPNNSELATLLNGKQNVINDLSAIRSGASAGATAIQPADLTDALNGVEAEIAGLDESKQDTIEDLSTIRSGAAAGATAYQKPGTGIPESDMSEGVQSALDKADSAYQKPSSGIPATDMSESVQASLDKANSAVQTETDPVFSGSPAAEITQADINNWNAKQSAIADLADIREGAAAGATAVQPDEMAQAIDGVDGDIDAINAKIPTAASNLNQLADKAYVNSSIATNSATYRGSFNLITDLGMNVDATHAQIAGALATAITTADNNDYAFVQIPDSASTPTVIAKIERYKHNGSGWVYEYDLNNSGFTAAQWAAINSGITSGLVGKLADLPNNSELATLLNGKQNVISDLSAIRSGASAGATAVQPADLTEALNDVEAEIAGLDDSKQDVIEDLSTIRSGAAAGATAYQKPGAGIPESDMSEGVQSALEKAEDAYQKPVNGIPSTDMDAEVQAALEKANSAVQTESDPVFSNSPAAEITQADINNWNAKQPAIADLADIREGAAAGATAVQPDEMAQAIDEVDGDIDAINAKIPSTASSLNQLADKAYVNSSIATNSATYRGSFNLITDLGMNVDATHAQIAGALATAITTADNNDYAFVQIPDSASTPTVIAKIERYKHNGSGWVYEYDLNNSGFTAAQWSAINSGITSGLVGKLTDLPNNSELATLLNGKQNVINDLSAIRSGAAAGATAVQPADLTEALGDLPTADNEDIHVNPSNKYQFKNRGTSDGMGYIIVRTGSSLASQMTQPNTIYEIRYDFSLSNSTLTVPENCVLKFEGGSLRNGTINVGNAVFIEAPCNKIFYNLTISGKIANNSAPLNWWCSSSSSADVTDDLSSAFSTSVREFIVNGIYAISSPVKLPSNAVIKGQGPSNFKRYGFKALPTFSEKTINNPRIPGTTHVVHGMFYHYYDYKPIIKDIFINADFHAKFCIEHVAGYSCCNIYRSTLENAKFACMVQYACEQPIFNELVCLSSHIGFYSSTKRLLDGDITSSSGDSVGQNNLIQLTQCCFANCNYGAVVENSSNISLHSCKFAQNSIFALILRGTSAYISDIYSERDGNCDFWINPDTGEKTTAQSGQTLAYLYEETHTIGGVTTSGRLDGITPGVDFKFSPSSNGEKAYYRAPIYIKSAFLNIESAYISYQNRGFQGTVLPPSPDTKTEAGVDSIMLIELSNVRLNNVVQYNHNNPSLPSLYAYIIDLRSSVQSQTLSFIHSSGSKILGSNRNNKIYVTAPHGTFNQIYNKLGSESNIWNYFIEGFSSNDYNFNVEDRIRGAGYDTNHYRYNFKQNIFSGFIKNAPLYKIIHTAGGLDGLYINKDDIVSFFGKREQIKIVFFAKILNDIDSVLVRFDFSYATNFYTFHSARQVYCSLTDAKAGEVYKFKQIVFLKPPISANIEDSWKYLYLHNYLSIATTDVALSDIFMYDVEDGEELIPNYQSVYMPSGTTAIRPDASNVAIGTHYFDTNLGKDLVSNGTAWVDATGATV